ncbi:adenylate kinase 8 isoform X7 [Castor canadensis]|uniref:Adenylate kinase 8 isoform X7 n=1 Tax=Castor canadensis TaxID=51338 RepID=A0AC58KVT8_CASCN
MDATTAPHIIPPEMPQYGEENHIFELMQAMLEQLLIHQPKEPISFMIEHLQRNNDHGNVAIQTSEQQSPHQGQLNSKTVSPCGFRSQQALPEDQDDFQHAVHPAASGAPGGRRLHPEVMLKAPDTVLIERNLGKRIDPQTGEIYHTTFDWPSDPDVQNRLVEPAGISELETAQKLLDYHRNIIRILPSYPKILKTISADQPCVDVFYQALTYVQSNHRTNAPFTPRVLLCGPQGSGKSLQAALLAQKYGLVNVCCGQLLKETVADKSSFGELIEPFFEKKVTVPDSIIIKVLVQRLEKQDCVQKGWVLHGFPRDLDQAQMLKKVGFSPNRVFFLNVPLDSIIERLTLRRTDPVTGERFHLMYKPPPTMEIQARLLQNPKDSEEQIKLEMDLFYRNSAELEQFYRQAIILNGDQDPYTVFEYIESGIINPLPTKVS